MGDAYQRLDQYAAQALDCTYNEMTHFREMIQNHDSNCFIKCLTKIRCCNRVYTYFNQKEIILYYDMVNNFIDCSKEVKSHLADFNKDTTGSAHDLMEKEISNISKEVNFHIKQAETIINHDMKEFFREIIKSVSHRRAVYFVLTQTAQYVQHQL
jgi:hypothetical protein